MRDGYIVGNSGDGLRWFPTLELAEAHVAMLEAQHRGDYYINSARNERNSLPEVGCSCGCHSPQVDVRT